VQRLRLLKRLLGLGHAVGDVAALPVGELEALFEMHAESADLGSSDEALPVLNRYLEHLECMQIEQAEQALMSAAMALPRRQVIDRLLAPLLTEVGARWETGRLDVAHEHAVSAMVRTHLGAMLRMFAPEPGAPSCVATTPTGEHHELGALMASVVAAMTGWRSIYLGPDLPPGELTRAARRSAASAVLVSVVSLAPAATGEFLREVDSALPSRTALVVGGAAAQDLESLPNRAIRVASLAELEDWLLRRPPEAGGGQ
jgi:methanogenic corrinoid protein MtbC1